MFQFKTYSLDYPPVKGRAFDVFQPEAVTKDIALFFVHGGGWRTGGKEGFHEIMAAFRDQGYIVASTGYRLGAKDAFQQLQDIRETYDGFVTVLKEMNRPLKIAVYGVSAGAHLASLLVFAEPGECGETAKLVNEWVKPCKAMLQATPCDFLYFDEMMPSMWSIMQEMAGVPYDEDPEPYERLSLKNYVRENNPPVFFIEAELETMFYSEHTLKIAKRHREMGIQTHWKVYHLMEHGFFYELRRKGQKDAFRDICLFLEDQLETI